MKTIRVIVILLLLVFNGGCGLIARLGSPSNREKVVPAEYNLAEQKGAKILVLVNQPGWLDTDINLRFRLTEVIVGLLERDARIPAESFIDYDKLFEFRSGNSGFSLLSAPQVGKAVGADLVLSVEVSGYELKKTEEMDYYSGFLSAQSALFDAVRGTKLWPMVGNSKPIKVGFEVEKHGKDVALVRLLLGTARSLTRYLYNCPKNKYKFADDRNVGGWEEWK